MQTWLKGAGEGIFYGVLLALVLLLIFHYVKEDCVAQKQRDEYQNRMVECSGCCMYALYQDMLSNGAIVVSMPETCEVCQCPDGCPCKVSE